MKTVIANLVGHTEYVDCIFEEKEGSIITAGYDGVVKKWDETYKNCIATIRWHDGNVPCMIFLENNKICSCGFDNLIKIWE